MKQWIELIAAVIMGTGLVLICYHRIKERKGIGVRVIQFLAVVLLLPIILILALERVLATETTAALLGTIVGYVLSGIGKDEK